MSCNRISRECGVCKNLVSVISATITAGKLVLNIPAGTYQNNQEVCLLISQALPVSNTPIPVVITIGGTATQYPFINKCGNSVYSDQIRSRQIYCTSFKSDTKLFKYNGCKPLCCTDFIFLPVTVGTATALTEIKGGTK